MCLALINLRSTLPKEHFVNAFRSNSDGMGMMWTNGRQLSVHKQLGNVDTFYEKYLEVRGETELPILIHFRLATHGYRDLANCHPFFVHDTVGFIHNGIFSEMPRSREYSDTQMFNKLILQALPKNFMEHRGIALLIEKYVGGYNKLIFLRHDGQYQIYNEVAGTWDGDNWYSNSCYKGWAGVAGGRYYGYDEADWYGASAYQSKATPPRATATEGNPRQLAEPVNLAPQGSEDFLGVRSDSGVTTAHLGHPYVDSFAPTNSYQREADERSELEKFIEESLSGKDPDNLTNEEFDELAEVIARAEESETFV